MNKFYQTRIRQEKKDHELIAFLDDYFHGRRQLVFDAEGNVTSFVYSKSDGNYFLELFLNNNGRISKIEPREKLSSHEASEIEALIKDALFDESKKKVGQAICFLSGTVERYFKCEEFQILPIPAHAPKPLSLQHSAFLLQYAFPASTDWKVNIGRRQAVEQSYRYLFGLFLKTHIIFNPSAFQLIWTMDRELRTEERFQGYHYEGLNNIIDDFSDVTDYQAAQRIPFQEYYGSMFPALTVMNAANTELEFPDNLCASFEKVQNLNEQDKEKFSRACFWFHQAQEMWGKSLSVSLVALVTAIECLAGKSKEKCSNCNQDMVATSERCTQCGQPQYQVTQNFKLFVESYFPATANYQKALGLLYRTRSGLVHGSDVLLRDSHPWIFDLDNTKALQQGDIHRHAYLVTKIVLYNWLHSRQ